MQPRLRKTALVYRFDHRQRRLFSGKLRFPSIVAYQKATLSRMILCTLSESGHALWLSITAAPPALDGCIVDKAVRAHIAHLFFYLFCHRTYLANANTITIAILSFTAKSNHVSRARRSTLPVSTVRKHCQLVVLPMQILLIPS